MIPNFNELLSSIQSTITLSVNLNGKFAGTLELHDSHVGDADAIFKTIQLEFKQ